MATTDRQIAKGTRLSYSTTSGGTYTKLGGIVGISGPNMDRDVVDASELDEAPDTLPGGKVEQDYFWKRKAPGTKDAGEVTLDVNMTEAAHTIVKGWFNQDTLMYYKITMRNGYIIPFPAYIKGIGLEVQDGNLVKAPITLLPSFDIGFTASP